MTLFAEITGGLPRPITALPAPSGLSTTLNNIQANVPEIKHNGVFKSTADTNAVKTTTPGYTTAGAGNGSESGYFRIGVAPYHDLVHVTPFEIDLGNLLSSQTREVFLWNANRYTEITVNSIVNNAGAGLEIEGITLPATLAQFSDLKFTLSISSDGDSTIDGTIDIITSAGTLSIEISGRRVVAWHFIPQDPVQEVMQFSTGIVDVHDGTEYRNAERNAPRTNFRFNHRKRDDGLSSAFIQNVLFDWQSRVFGVPRWWEQHRLEAPLMLGVQEIPVNPDFSYFREGGLALLMQNELDNFEVVEIETITPGVSFTTKTPILKNYLEDSVVVPMQLAVTERSVQQSLYTIGADDTSINFTSIDDSPIEAVPYDTTFNGIPVFDGDNILPSGNKYRRRFNNPFLRTEFGGLPFTFDKTDRSDVTQPKTFAIHTSREELWKVRSWMHALKGSQGVFYLSSFRNDFQLNSAIGAGSGNIDVRNAGFGNFSRSRSPRSAVEIYTTDGQVFRRNINSATSIDEFVERISIDQPIPNGYAVNQVNKISILSLCRIADDNVKLLHEGVGNGLISINCKGVRA